MNYELYKKLYEAGFPQHGNGFFIADSFKVSPEMIEPGGIYKIPNESVFYIPTLSELI